MDRIASFMQQQLDQNCGSDQSWLEMLILGSAQLWSVFMQRKMDQTKYQLNFDLIHGWSCFMQPGPGALSTFLGSP